MQRFLLNRLREAPTVPSELLAVAHRLRTANGQVAIGELAARSGLSLRHLERGFKALAGVSPKVLARRMRCECVLTHLRHDPFADLATLAYSYGFADQAHLSREVRTFAGRAPTQLRTQEVRRRTRLDEQSVAQRTA